MEDLIKNESLSLDQMNLDQMDIYWNKVKKFTTLINNCFFFEYLIVFLLKNMLRILFLIVISFFLSISQWASI